MNRPPETFVSVQEDRLLAFSTACFEKAGLSYDHAALISRLLVNSDLRGVRSHGTRTVNGYCSGFENGDMNPQPNIQLVHETPTAVVLDGDGTLGYLPMVRATEGAIAKSEGGWVGHGACASHRTLRLGRTLYADMYGGGLYRLLCSGLSESRQCRWQRSETATRLLWQSAPLFCDPRWR